MVNNSDNLTDNPPWLQHFLFPSCADVNRLDGNAANISMQDTAVGPDMCTRNSRPIWDLTLDIT